MKRGSAGLDPVILNTGITWREVVSFTPRLLYLRGKRPRYPVNRRVAGPQSWSGHTG
jgi:hypothetical protein